MKHVYIVRFFTTKQPWLSLVFGSIESAYANLRGAGFAVNEHFLYASNYQEWTNPSDTSQTATITKKEVING